MLPKRSQTISAAISLLFAPLRLDAPSFAKFKMLWWVIGFSKLSGSLIHGIMKASGAFRPILLTFNKNSAVSD